MTLRACEREDLGADDRRGAMHFTEVRERELQKLVGHEGRKTRLEGAYNEIHGAEISV